MGIKKYSAILFWIGLNGAKNFEISHVWNVDRIFILDPILTCYFSLNWLFRELRWSVDWFPPTHTVSIIHLTETCGNVQILSNLNVNFSSNYDAISILFIICYWSGYKKFSYIISRKDSKNFDVSFYTCINVIYLL